MMENLMKSLEIMGLGMFAIFVVISVLILAVWVMKKLDRGGKIDKGDK